MFKYDEQNIEHIIYYITKTKQFINSYILDVLYDTGAVLLSKFSYPYLTTPGSLYNHTWCQAVTKFFFTFIHVHTMDQHDLLQIFLYISETVIRYKGRLKPVTGAKKYEATLFLNKFTSVECGLASRSFTAYSTDLDSITTHLSSFLVCIGR